VCKRVTVHAPLPLPFLPSPPPSQVEIDQADVTNMQKMMIRRCRSVGKPVIVATQMLESMQINPRPTRAEVSDVTVSASQGSEGEGKRAGEEGEGGI